MRSRLTLACVMCVLLAGGCSTKKYFEPTRTYNASSALGSSAGTITDVGRKGATLADGRFIDQRGVSTQKLADGFRYLGGNARYVLAGNAEGILHIIRRDSGEVLRAVALHVPIVSATIDRGIVAYILNNNAFGLYRIEDNRKLIEQRGGKALAIDTRAASPMLLQKHALFPMLDGKLMILNLADPASSKLLPLGKGPFFDNIIFLEGDGDDLIVANGHVVVRFGSGEPRRFEAAISEVAVGENGNVYLFTKEGTIIKLNRAMKAVASRKFPFAHFSAAAYRYGRVYGLDHHGSLLVLDQDLKQVRIYRVGKLDTPPFIAGDVLYLKDHTVNLAKLR